LFCGETLMRSIARTIDALSEPVKGETEDAAAFRHSLIRDYTTMLDIIMDSKDGLIPALQRLHKIQFGEDTP
jgi:hypothetical protein